MNVIKKYFQLNLEAIMSRELDLKERKQKEFSLEKEIMSSYKLWLSNLKECIRKSCYRRVLGMINKMPIEFCDCYNYLEIEILRIRCIIKIITRKTEKYAQELRENRIKERKSIEFWINQLCFSISHIILELRPDLKENNLKQFSTEETMNRLEYTIYYLLRALYHLIMFSGKMNEVPQMCSYFAMCARLDGFIAYCRKPKTLQSYIILSLLKSRLFIQNSDYPNALVEIENTITICFRQCFLLVDFDEGLNCHIFDNTNSCNNIKKCDNSIIYTCFIHMIVAFYQRGLCYEFQGNMSKSIEAYKQSSWICNKFIKASCPLLAELFSKLLKRALCYHEVIKDILDYDSRLKERIRKEKQDKRLIEQNESEAQKRQRELLQKIANGDQTSHLKRLDHTAEIISNLEIKELEFYDKKEYPKRKYITSTLSLIDYLLNDSFRPILKQMNTLELHCLDSETQRKIEKKILQSSNSNCLNKSNSCSLLCINNNIISNNNQSNSHSNNHSNTNTNSQTKRKTKVYMKRYPIQNKIKEMKIKATNRSTIMSPSLKYSPDKVERLKVDNTFDKDFRQKRNFLERYNSKEIKFHKNLLLSKKNEVNEKPNAVIAQYVRNNVENFIKLRLLSNKEVDAKRILRNFDSQKDLQFFEKQMQLENQVLKSLSTKSYSEYQKNLLSSKTLNTSKSQFTSLGLSHCEYSMKSNANLDIIKKLNSETDRIDWIKSYRSKKKFPY